MRTVSGVSDIFDFSIHYISFLFISLIFLWHPGQKELLHKFWGIIWMVGNRWINWRARLRWRWKFVLLWHGMTISLHGKPNHSRSVSWKGTKRQREMPIHRQDFQQLNIPLKRDKAILENQTIGTPIALTILQRVRGTTQDVQLGWRQFPWILPTIWRTFFWILVTHNQLNQERQSESSKNMRCVMVLQQNSVVAISLLCLPTLRQKLVGKPCSTLMCLRWTACNYPILLAADAELECCTWTGSKRS